MLVAEKDSICSRCIGTYCRPARRHTDRQHAARGNSGGYNKELKRVTLRLGSGREIAAFLEDLD